MENKTVLITGASGGIGGAIAEIFAKNGYNIVYHYNRNLNESLVEKLSSMTNVLPIQADFTKPLQIADMARIARETFGKIDVLVNNAGVARICPIVDEDYEGMEKHININLTAPAYLTSLISQNMCKYQTGNIIFVSSIWGVYGGAVESTYSATKAGLIGLTKALANELGPNGIRVNAVAPGLIDTKMNNDLTYQEKEEFVERVSLERIGRPKDVAKAVYFLASEESSYINGEVLTIDGGLKFGV